MKGHAILRVLWVAGLSVLLWLTTLLAPAGVQALSSSWRGEYFSNANLAGGPKLVRYDSDVDFDWGEGSPDSRIPADRFSVRWTRSAQFDSGRYRFKTETDDGVRLYVDGELVIDHWQEMAPTTYTAERRLKAGVHTLRMEYYERKGGATARLSWEQIVTAAGGNIVTCVRPVDSWIKVYRLDGDHWADLRPTGWGPLNSRGDLKLDGMPVDLARYGAAGHPYRVELWAGGKLVRAVGDTAAGQPEFRVHADADNYTPWGCPAP